MDMAEYSNSKTGGVMMKIKIYKSRSDGEWRWRMIARNGRVIGCSGEGYKNLSHCQKMARMIMYGTFKLVVKE